MTFGRRALMVMGLTSVLGIGSARAGQDTTPSGARQICLLKVTDMACGVCAATVEKTVRRIDGVTSVTVSQPTKGSALDIPFTRALGWFSLSFGALRAPGPLCGSTTGTKFSLGAA